MKLLSGCFFTSKIFFDICIPSLKWFCDPDVFFSSSNEWNEWRVCAYVCVSACVCVLQSVHAYLYVLCLFIFIYAYFSKNTINISKYVKFDHLL